MMPNRLINSLQEYEFSEIVNSELKGVCLYIGIKYTDDLYFDTIQMFYSMMRGKWEEFNVAKLVSIVSSLMYEDIKRISVKTLHDQAKKSVIKQQQTEFEEDIIDRDRILKDSIFGKALNLRMKYDKGGIILEKNNHTLKHVVNSIEQGLNYYTNKQL